CLCGWVGGGWWDRGWSPGVVRLIMDGWLPAQVPDAVIGEIRSRERNGWVELPKLRLEPGARVRVLQGPLQDQIGLLAALRPHERVLVLLQLLGGQQRGELARNAVAAIGERPLSCRAGGHADDPPAEPVTSAR